jgi:DNA polymerase elongation subunit (family B)
MLAFLEYVLTQRENYKALMKKAGKNAEKIKEKITNKEYNSEEELNELNKELLYWESDKAFNDKKQLPQKILANSFFGSYGAPNVFNWGSIDCAERTTCVGRMALRLMIYRFNYLGYKPIVGDSFTGDTPLFIKYKKSGCIDIVPIEKLINENEISIDGLGREYDYSSKPYYVLCRSGWVEPSYIYRHKTNKPLYKITDGEMVVDVTEDHSLFNEKQEKIKPSEINENTKLEYYKGVIDDEKNKEINLVNYNTKLFGMKVAKQCKDYEYIPTFVYNDGKSTMKEFYDSFMENYDENKTYNKSVIAGLQYIKRMLIEEFVFWFF